MDWIFEADIDIWEFKKSDDNISTDSNFLNKNTQRTWYRSLRFVFF